MDETGVEQRGGLGSYLSPKLLNWLMLIFGAESYRIVS